MENEERETLEPMVLVTRSTWGAQPPKKKAENMNFPILRVVVSFMTDTEAPESEEDCKQVMQALQKRHMSEGLPDIAYNFVIGGDGHVYEGSGWRTKSCNPKFPEFNDSRLDIAYMGNYNRNELPFPMYLAGIQLLSNGVDSKLMHAEYNCTEDPDTAPDYEE